MINMQKDIYFSIIVPVYNVKNYLQEAVDSILNQTYKGYEIILVDDGSDDGSEVLCDEISKSISRVKAIHQQSQGASQARNNGMKIASGKYLLFLDSDDLWLDREYLNKLKDKINIYAEPDLVVLSHYTEIDITGKYLAEKSSGINTEQINRLPYDEALSSLVRSNYFPISPWAKVIKRDVVYKYKLFFEPGLRSEDIDWSFKVFDVCKTVFFWNEKNYAYRIRGNSTSHYLTEKTYSDLLFIIVKWSKIFKKDKNNIRKTAMLGILSYEYFILIGIRAILKDFKKHQKELKELWWLSQYSYSRKTILCRMLIQILGIRLGAFIIAKYIERKR